MGNWKTKRTVMCLLLINLLGNPDVYFNFKTPAFIFTEPRPMECEL
jgi:hypothetical protein